MKRSLVVLFFAVVFAFSANAQCPLQENIASSSITDTEATLSWDASTGSVDFYRYRYRIGNGDWTYGTTTSLSANLTGLITGTQYTWQTRTFCTDPASSAWSSNQFFTTTGISACGVPTNIGTTPSTTSIDVTWDDMSADTYTLRYRDENGDLQTTTGIVTNSHSITGLLEAQDYDIEVRSVCSGIQSDWSAVVNESTTLSYSCTTPSGLSVSPVTDSSATINWTSLGPTAQYRIRYRRTGEGWTVVGDLTGSSHEIMSLLEGTEYRWQIRTECSADNVTQSAWSTEQTFTTNTEVDCTGKLPTGTVTSGITFIGATFNWDDMGVPLYRVRYRRSDGNFSWNFDSSLTTSFSITGQTDSLPIEWQVKSDCSAGEVIDQTEWTTETNFLTLDCSPPESGFVESGETDSQATLDWDAFANATDGYAINYLVKGASASLDVNVVSNTATLTGLYSGVQYRYEIASRCDVANGIISEYTVSPIGDRKNFFTTGVATCQPPSSHSLSGITETALTIDWTDVGSLGYEVSTLLVGGSGNTWTVATASSSSSHTVSSGLISGQRYYTRVRSVCTPSSDLVSSWSSQIIGDLTGDGGCPPPTFDSVSALTSSSAVLNWGSVSGADEYYLRHKIVGGSWTYVQGITDTSYSLSSLTAATEYRYDLRSICSGVQSAWLDDWQSTFTTAAASRNGFFDESVSEMFTIFPNPAEELINIQLPFKGSSEISLINSLGQVSKEWFVDGAGAILDISDVDEGTYYLRVVNGESVDLQKVVVQ